MVEVAQEVEKDNWVHNYVEIWDQLSIGVDQEEEVVDKEDQDKVEQEVYHLAHYNNQESSSMIELVYLMLFMEQVKVEHSAKATCVFKLKEEYQPR